MQSDLVEYVLHQPHRLEDAVERAFLRIEVDQDVIGVVERFDPAHPRILVDAAEVGQEQQRRAVVRDDEADRFAPVLGVNGFDSQPAGVAFRDVLLEEEVFVNAVRIALQRERVAREMRDDPLGDGVVVVQDVALGDSRRSETTPCRGW